MHVNASLPTDSCIQSADTIHESVKELEEFTIDVVARRVFRKSKDGEITMDPRLVAETPALMGNNDPIAFFRTLPAVQTSAELQPGIYVRGSGNGSNHFESDGARIFNPMHMLGLYSAYNPSFYRNFDFRSGYMPPYLPSATGGFFGAYTSDVPDTLLSGIATVGLIESHMALKVPVVKGKASISGGLRKTYLNLVFPDILKLGDSSLKYGFTDMNISGVVLLGKERSLKLSAFGNSDGMTLASDRYGSKSGNFGWRNLAASAAFMTSGMKFSASFSSYAGSFEMEEGGRLLDLPSGMWQVSLNSCVRRGEFVIGADVNMRRSSGLRNHALEATLADIAVGSLEGNLSGMWRHVFGSGFRLETGMRMTYYHCGANNAVYPQPRLLLAKDLQCGLCMRFSYGRHMRFDRLIEMTSGGFPADFMACCDGNVPPEDVHSFEIAADGVIPCTGLVYSAEGYFKILRGGVEFKGSLLDMTTPAFQPLENLEKTRGYAWGISLTLSRQIGRLRGRVAYNLGQSKVRGYGVGNGYFPSSHDRLHDLSASLAWSVTRDIILAANFTYATGTPYTKAKYGYMIGENLICEYYPRNSSRLPDYMRLDFSALWTFCRKGRMKHSVNLSVYNAAALRNVLFVYTDYSLDQGILHRESVMKSVIPSISYTFEF